MNWGNEVLTYGYLADGQKREKKFNGTATQYYCGSMVYDGSGTPEDMAVHTSNGQWEWRYHLTDHLGNVRAVLDENGAVLQQIGYYPLELPIRLIIPIKINASTSIFTLKIQ